MEVQIVTACSCSIGAWFVKILTFQAEFLLLNPQFLPSLPFVFFLLPQIFLHFPADCGSCNKDKRHGAIGVGRSHGCIPTSYLTALNSRGTQKKIPVHGVVLF